MNSAYFGLPQRTESIVKAVSYLGIENLKGLLVAVHVFNPDNFPAILGLSPETLRDDALMTATLARKIVGNPKLADSAFAAGIVHDVGQLMLARDPSKQYGAIVRTAGETHEALQLVEERELGITHALVGAYLLGVWGLPFSLSETVAYHHTPSLVLEGSRLAGGGSPGRRSDRFRSSPTGSYGEWHPRPGVSGTRRTTRGYRQMARQGRPHRNSARGARLTNG